MPDSRLDLSSREARLRRFLLESFPAPQASVSVELNAPHPLLLLRFRHDLAGFALANGNPRDCFQESYSYFKTLYADRHREWDDLNLVFVLCLSHRDRDLDAFYASVETDVFFCRKFTISLDAPLDAELARLPFFPLSRRQHRTLRPPSAQTLLKALGVPAALASSVVGRVGEESILEDCLTGRFGMPKLRDPEAISLEAGGEAGQPVRVELLEIENFRAYRTAASFDIDADLVVLYGPNGFGKTSFFDAMDFVATGDIGRLGLGTKEDRFLKAARHLDAGAESGSVKLRIRGDDGNHTLHRRVRHRRQPRLDDAVVDRKEALIHLTNPLRTVGTDHVEHLVRLFRATHLFSQEFQELTEEFREHCRLSSEVVSRMLTVEDYVNGRRKVTKVLDVIRGRAAARNQEIGVLTEVLKQVRAEMARLRRSSQPGRDHPQAISRLRQEVLSILTAVGIDAGTDTDALSEARGWRAVLEARISDSSALTVRLSEVNREASLIGDWRTERSTLEVQRAQNALELIEANRAVRRSTEAQARVDAELGSLLEQERKGRRHAQMLAWRRQTKPAYETLIVRSDGLATEIGALSQSLADQNEELERLATARIAAETHATRTGRIIEEGRQLAIALTSLQAEYSEWVERTSRRRVLQRTMAERNMRLDEVRRDLQDARNDLRGAEEEETKAIANVALEQRSQAELEQLVSALEAYVTGPQCPACGSFHGSREAVLQRLRDSRSAGSGPSGTSSSLDAVRQQVLSCRARVEQLSGTLATEEAEARNTVVEEAALGTEVGEFEERARELDLDVLAADFLARVDTRISTTETANSAFVRLAEEHREETGAARVALDELRARADSLRQEIEGKRLALKEATEQVDQIRREASRSGIDVNITEEQVDADERSLGDEARRVASLISAKRAEQAASKEAVGENAKRARALKTESDGVATSLRTVEQTIARYERELRACGLENESSQSEVAARLEQHVRRTAALEQAKQRVLDFEMALDAAARSAESERLTVRARVAEASLKEAKQHKADEAIWVPYFEGLGARLEETQDRAVAGYTEDYGPLTSTIQRRLRSVSGFEEISLHPEGDRIAVRVARNGEQLPPTDFFSQSQQQILILSLFFTACLTQTWSGFAPILLDDPVTHFDDLNAYAFLDLIGGFLETEPHERQFILSTCDERLFLLARQRFQHLGEQFKSYRFVSCGREGPVVERL